MKGLATMATLAAGTNALVARGDTCCFGLEASGGASGSIGQLSDGQNRIGGGLPPGKFCLGTGGGLTDGQGRGCILTPPTTQFQCDSGASPTTGFSISSSGELEFNGSPKFIACQTGDNGELNIYTNPPSDQVSGCVEITLEADNCKPAPPPSSASVVVVTVTESVCLASYTRTTTAVPMTSTAPAPVQSATTTATAATSTMPSSTGCPAALSGNYEYPHLIVPIDSSSPNTAKGTSFNGEVTSTVSSIFDFDIPASDSGKTCSLVFLFPNQADLQTSSFTFSGDGKIDVSELMSPATQSTTFNNAPGVKQDFGDFTIAPGHSYSLATFSCPAGQRVAFELKNAGTTNMNYFQDYNPSPIGLYITVC